MVNNASLGLGKPRLAGLGLAAGAITTSGALIALGERASPEVILAIGSVSVLFMIPAARAIAAEFGDTFSHVWLRSIFSFLPALLAIVLVCALASINHSIIATAVAILISLALCARDIFGRAPAACGALLGYDTRSWRSAIVMRAIDLIRPFRRAEPFTWAGPCVVSSVAGLGDLFMHLPLIAGIIKEAHRRSFPIRVALRPEHIPIGIACGWDVIAFDDTLVDLFKAPEKLRPLTIWNHIRQARRERASLWIDLTGNAISALAIKAAGARKLASRVTRGGRSFVDYLLPHTLHENEYGNVERVASSLECQLDYSIFERLRGTRIASLQDAVVLCLTTACQWRNWPLENFLALVDRFPNIQFVATGIKAEAAPEERMILATIAARPNVKSLLDQLSVMQLIRLIAHSRAVVTNDTSTAHIASAFRKPGAVLFGPASPDKLAAPFGLKSFVDRTCPFHPCVQWTCRNQENWCMRKIDVEQVAGYLATLPGFATTSKRSITQPEFVSLPAAAAQW
jgi:ADP-heptose:LPS heptosyltransferase